MYINEFTFLTLFQKTTNILFKRVNPSNYFFFSRLRVKLKLKLRWWPFGDPYSTKVPSLEFCVAGAGHRTRFHSRGRCSISCTLLKCCRRGSNWEVLPADFYLQARNLRWWTWTIVTLVLWDCRHFWIWFLVFIAHGRRNTSGALS